MQVVIEQVLLALVDPCGMELSQGLEPRNLKLLEGSGLLVQRVTLSSGSNSRLMRPQPDRTPHSVVPRSRRCFSLLSR